MGIDCDKQKKKRITVGAAIRSLNERFSKISHLIGIDILLQSFAECNYKNKKVAVSISRKMR
jgi:hypothetical protein